MLQQPNTVSTDPPYATSKGDTANAETSTLTLLTSIAPATGSGSSSAALPLGTHEQPSLPKNVYVRNLPDTVTESDMPAIFSRFGAIESSKLMVDIKTGASRCFGFVLFQEHAAAAAAVGDLDGITLMGSRLSVRFADPKTRRPGEASDCVFLRNLPGDFTEGHVRALCASTGAPVSVTLRRDERHGQRGCSAAASSGEEDATSLVAHVSMPSVESAAALVRRLNHSAQFAHAVGAPLQAKVVDASKKLRPGATSRPTRTADVSNSGVRANEPATPPARVHLQPAGFQRSDGLPALDSAPIRVQHGHQPPQSEPQNYPQPQLGNVPQAFYPGPAPAGLFGGQQYSPAVVLTQGSPVPLYHGVSCHHPMSLVHARDGSPYQPQPQLLHHHHLLHHHQLLPVAFAHHHQSHQMSLPHHQHHQQQQQQQQQQQAMAPFLPASYSTVDQAAAPAGPIQPRRPAQTPPRGVTGTSSHHA